MKINGPGRGLRKHVLLWGIGVIFFLPFLDARDIPPVFFNPVTGYFAGTIWLAARIEDELVRYAEEVERERKLKFFTAIIDNDQPTFCAMLNHGEDPNVVLPFPPPKEFTKKIHDELLGFYVAKEPGFTALMTATATGNLPFVKMLLAAGAAPYKMTSHYRTYALWLAGKYHYVEIMQSLLRLPPDSEAWKLRIVVDIASQKATLFCDGRVELETSISSGRESHPTPRGLYVVTDKYPVWKSSLYHSAPMPLFLRLSCGDFGLHAGYLPGYPASHGCIRLPEKAARTLFTRVPEGTVVEIR